MFGVFQKYVLEIGNAQNKVNKNITFSTLIYA